MSTEMDSVSFPDFSLLGALLLEAVERNTKNDQLVI